MRHLSRTLLRATIAVLILIALLWAAASLSWPFGFDHGVFAWVGDVILRGGVPYRDAFDVKGPMSFLPSAAVMAVAGRNWWGVRLFDLLLVAGVSWTIFRLASRYAGHLIASAATVLWILAYANTGFENTAQPDGWMLWLVLFALVPACLADTPVRRRHLLLMGVAVGLATMLKPFYIAFLLMPAVLAERGRERAAAVGLVGAGFLIPVAIMLAWLSSHAALPAFWEAYIRFNAEKNSQALAVAASDSLSYGLLRDPVTLLFLPLAVAGVAALRTVHRRAAVVFGLWLVLALPLVLMQRPYYPYRLQILTPVIAILVAVAFGAMTRSGEWPASARSLGAVAGCALLLLGGVTFGRHPLGDGLRWLRFASGRISAATYYARFPVWRATATDERATARALAGAASPEDRVFAWNHPSVAVLAGRPLTPRLSIQTPVQERLPVSVRQRYLDELARTLRDAAPSFVVTEDTLGRGGACLACLPPYAALGARGDTLAAPYRLLFQSGNLVLYRRQ